MQIIFLPTAWTILVDCIAWMILQPAIAYLAIRLPLSLFRPRGWLFRTHRWENEGKLYDKFLRVKSWKARLPSGGTVFRGFSMKKIISKQETYLERWLIETCRAELTHWAAILVSPLFFLWNPVWVGFVMIAYAMAFNLPCIIVQRYNRPHLNRILQKRR